MFAAAVLGHQPLDVDPPLLVGAGHDPQRIGRSGGVNLNLIIETVYAFVPLRGIPVGDAVLMPRDRSAEPGLLDEDYIIEGYEIVTIDRRGNGQQLRMAINAQARRHVLAHAAHAVDHIRRRIVVGCRLSHPARMAAFAILRSAIRIRQRLDQRVRLARGVEAERLPALRVDLGVVADRRPLQHHAGIAAQLVDFRLADDAFENIVSVLPVGRENFRVQAAVGIESRGTTVADLPRPPHALLQVGCHAFGVLGACWFGSGW